LGYAFTDSFTDTSTTHFRHSQHKHLKCIDSLLLLNLSLLRARFTNIQHAERKSSPILKRFDLVVERRHETLHETWRSHDRKRTAIIFIGGDRGVVGWDGAWGPSDF
jgi:hypothetical protein